MATRTISWVQFDEVFLAVLVRFDHEQLAALFHPVEEQDAIEMIDLMLNDNRVDALHPPLDLFPVFTACPEDHPGRAHGVPGHQPRQAQAAIEPFSEWTGLDDFRVDQR